MDDSKNFLFQTAPAVARYSRSPMDRTARILIGDRSYELCFETCPSRQAVRHVREQRLRGEVTPTA